MARRPVFELAAVTLTGASFLAYDAAGHARAWFIVPCMLAWGGYIAARIGRDRSVAKGWGIRLDNLAAAARPCVALLLAGGAAMGGYRLLRGWRGLPLSSLVIFALYPLWAFFQQFLVQALVAGNLRRLRVPLPAVIPLAAALFGVIHAPNWVLVGLCVPAGAVWTLLFFRTPNLLPLALCHGWLDALAYYWILSRDPFAELLVSQ